MKFLQKFIKEKNIVKDILKPFWVIKFKEKGYLKYRTRKKLLPKNSLWKNKKRREIILKKKNFVKKWNSKPNLFLKVK